MTANELIQYLNRMFGNSYPWPTRLEVSPETYVSCCQHIIFNSPIETFESQDSIRLWIGPNKGLMFKNIELIIIEEDE
jgi:hypothetical protein